jgi:anti-sigma B factor antagonist
MTTTGPSTSGELEVTATVVGAVAVVTLAGDLAGGTADVVEDQVASTLSEYRRVLLDLRQVRHVTGVGLRTLLLLYRHAQCLRASVALVGLSPELRDLLSATGYLRFFHVAETNDEALALLAERPTEKDHRHV